MKLRQEKRQAANGDVSMAMVTGTIRFFSFS